MKAFNTTVVCVPSKHYMVDISERLSEIKKLVDNGKYFTINRARQQRGQPKLKTLDLSHSQPYDCLKMTILQWFTNRLAV